MLRNDCAQAEMYQILDDILASGCIPSAARGKIFSVVDRLRSATSPSEDGSRAEKISIEIHKLEWALQKGDGHDVSAARQALKHLAVELLNSRICGKA